MIANSLEDFDQSIELILDWLNPADRGWARENLLNLTRAGFEDIYQMALKKSVRDGMRQRLAEQGYAIDF